LKAKNVGEEVMQTWAEIKLHDIQIDDGDEDLSF